MNVSARRALVTLLSLLPLAAAVYFLLREPANPHGIRFVLYRPAAAQFFLDHGAGPGGNIEYVHDATETVPFGLPGDVGLLCPQSDREDPRGYRVFAQGLWFLSGKSKRPPSGDLSFGRPGDLPFCADFNGDGLADSGVFRDGKWLIGTRTAGSADIQFSFGAAGDHPVVLRVPGAGNGTDRKNIVYGVYRRGLWHLDTKGTGAVDATHSFGGLPQDVPLLIPRWSSNPEATPRYSLAIFRDGTWYIKPDPDGPQTLSFGFGQPGDLPSVDY